MLDQNERQVFRQVGFVGFCKVLTQQGLMNFGHLTLNQMVVGSNPASPIHSSGSGIGRLGNGILTDGCTEVWRPADRPARDGVY